MSRLQRLRPLLCRPLTFGNERLDVPDYCTRCEAVKPRRTHHCRRCGTCVVRMDHHCPAIGPPFLLLPLTPLD